VTTAAITSPVNAEVNRQVVSKLEFPELPLQTAFRVQVTARIDVPVSVPPPQLIEKPSPPTTHNYRSEPAFLQQLNHLFQSGNIVRNML
jgi:hypothetical protein